MSTANAGDFSRELVLEGIFGTLTTPLARIIPDFLSYQTERDLNRCGWYGPASYDSYLAVRNVLVCGVLLVTMCWAVAVSDSPNLINAVFSAGAVLLAVAYALPRVVISILGDRRANSIFASIPDAMDMLVMGLAGGLSLEQALDHTTNELAAVSPGLAKEFRIISTQASAGSLEYALQRFAQRMDIDELTNMMEMIRNASSMGTPISRLLHQSADQFREARMQKVLRRGNTIALKMLFPTILCLAPAAFIVILSPPLIDLRSFRDRENRSNGSLSQDSLDRSLRAGGQKNATSNRTIETRDSTP